MSQTAPRWADEQFAPWSGNPRACKNCIYRATIFNGNLLDRADTSTCEMYEEPERKPDAVYWHGADCEYYEQAEARPQALLLGIAVADALGVPVEFKKRGTFHVKDMTGYGTYNQPPGTWSDDTSMTLALADSLLPEDLNLEGLSYRFIQWRDNGEYTPHGQTFDIGNATNRAIDRLKNGIAPEKAGGKEEQDNGNGSLMRIAPLVFFMFNRQAKDRYEITRKVSSITHAHPISITACFIFIELLNLIRKGRSKRADYAELKADFAYHKKFLDQKALAKFDRILNGDITRLEEKDIKSSGYVVDTLEAAIWAFLTTKNYREAVLKAVNLGEDTDTVGAVTGALAGLHYGLQDIPEEWLDKLAKREEIRDIAIKMPRWDLLPSA